MNIGTARKILTYGKKNRSGRKHDQWIHNIYTIDQYKDNIYDFLNKNLKGNITFLSSKY